MTGTHLVVVMGGAGCGKSAAAHALQSRPGWVVAESDDFHPASNVTGMSSGLPLTTDRSIGEIADLLAHLNNRNHARPTEVLL